MQTPESPALAASKNNALDPIFVDLDGTLICTDTLFELFVRILKHRPLSLLSLPFCGGIAALKHKMTALGARYLNHVPVNEKLLDYLREKKALGHRIFVITACEESLAKKIVATAETQGAIALFDGVFGTKGSLNLKGTAKTDFIEKTLGFQHYEYAGNARCDMPVWERSSKAIVVNAPAALARRATRRFREKGVDVIILKSGSFLGNFFKAIRIHQIAKNFLIFVPLFVGHLYGDLASIGLSVLAFAAFSFCSLGTYLFNDLLDLEADRAHAHKRRRPLAAGRLSIAFALVAIPAMLLFSLVLGFIANPGGGLIAILACYIVLTLSYSFYLKRLVVVDVIALAVLYMLRIFAGAVALDIRISPWLLGFALFAFFSLGMLKRFVEVREAATEALAGRGYVKSDTQVLLSVGVAAGMIAVLVYVIYIALEAFRYYQRADYLYYTTVIFIYFFTKIWVMAMRGAVHHDPVVYALKTKENYFLGLLFVCFFLLAQPLAP